jgi:hypothetical protein
VGGLNGHMKPSIHLKGYSFPGRGEGHYRASGVPTERVTLPKNWTRKPKNQLSSTGHVSCGFHMAPASDWALAGWPR